MLAATRAAAIKGAADIPARSPFMLRPSCRTLRALSCSDPYMRFLGGGSLDDDRMSTFVDRSPEALIFFEKCGIRLHVVRGVTDHYYGKSPGSHAIGRSVEVDLISGFDLGDWRDRVSTPDDVPCFVTAEEQ